MLCSVCRDRKQQRARMRRLCSTERICIDCEPWSRQCNPYHADRDRYGNIWHPSQRYCDLVSEATQPLRYTILVVRAAGLKRQLRELGTGLRPHLAWAQQRQQAGQRGADRPVAHRRHQPGAAAAHKPAEHPVRAGGGRRQRSHQVRQLRHCSAGAASVLPTGVENQASLHREFPAAR